MDDFWAGQEEFLGGNYSKAIKHYRTAYKTFSSMPENERTDEFLALIMRCMWQYMCRPRQLDVMTLCCSNCAAAEMRLEMSRKVVESCNQALTFDETCIRAYLLKGVIGATMSQCFWCYCLRMWCHDIVLRPLCSF